MKTKKEKISFLEALGIREVYEHNVVHYSIFTSDPKRIEFMYQNEQQEDFISGAFIWGITPQGKKFWEVVTKIWEVFLKC